jgi:hypothetical protein
MNEIDKSSSSPQVSATGEPLDPKLKKDLRSIQEVSESLEVLRDDPELPDEVYLQLRSTLRNDVGRIASEHSPDELPSHLPELP